ncbi:hypothetical protein BBP40_011819 [Aspergillus hancockii]|nr:hypothetical protein BBP40_011819 [Aspergillus hancockii]
MEVFIHNVPRDLSRQGLSRELEPVMNQLFIQDFLCEKPNKKPFGTITFLNPKDARRFLDRHGQKEGPIINLLRPPRTISNLCLMGVDVFCKESKHPPRTLALSTLEYASEQRTYDRPEEPIIFDMKNFSCGRCDFVGDQLTYSPEVWWMVKGTIVVKKRTVIVDMVDQRRIRIPLTTIAGLVYSTDGTLTVTLSDVPFLFESTQTTPLEVLAAQVSISVPKFRDPGAGPSRWRRCSLGDGHGQVIGQCLVYQFKVVPGDFMTKINRLKEGELSIISHTLPISRLPLASKGLAAEFQTLLKELAEYTKNNHLPFGILFQLQALAQNAYLHPATVLQLCKSCRALFIRDKEAGARFISVDAMKKSFNMIGWPFPNDNPSDYDAESLLAAIKQNHMGIQEGIEYREGLLHDTPNMARIFRVNVTPTRITLHGPETEPQNRILRKFPNHHEYFIRVQFCDENGEDLMLNSRVSYDDIFARFKEVMKSGIQIAGRTYKFLGFSHSSLRSHSVWVSGIPLRNYVSRLTKTYNMQFSSPFIDDNGHLQTYFSIISAIGKFSHITSPARCAARIGQAFSETPFTVPLREMKVLVSTIPDVTSADGSRVFSDGVGTISQEVVERIWADLLPKRGTPTAFQIRLGGAKGMLAIDSRLSSSVIQIRPSMVKFESQDMQNLEICNMASRPYPMVLNRQLIKILEDMGAPNNWFFQMQDAELERLRTITSSIDRTASFLKDKSVAGPIAVYRLFRQCCWLGMDYKRDGFLRAILEAVILRELRLLKHKARIPVKKGMTLYGIMDETGLLEANEVYVTFDPMDHKYTPPPAAGPLLVSRSPALHDGDIQRAHNVIPPEGHPLAQHQNCIVFSQKGDRDLPSQLSGGDLDGDLFHIIWDPVLSDVKTFAPADYPRVKPLDIGRVVEVDDMANFFVDFMRTDILGVIATRHMILADQIANGARYERCRHLAQLHSTAVDFSKTGIPVEISELPKIGRYRPDFLAPGPRTRLYCKSRIGLEQRVSHANYDDDDDEVERPHLYYKSERILGKLYRAIDERNIWLKHVRSDVVTDEELFWEELVEDVDARCRAHGKDSWEQYSEEAARIRAAYEDGIISCMNNYSEHPVKPITELEVLIGSIINENGVPTRRQRDRSIKLKDEFDRIASWIMGLMGREKTVGTEQHSLELCLACVHVGCEKSGPSRLTEMYGELKSFKIVAACALLFELDHFEKNRAGKCPTM